MDTLEVLDASGHASLRWDPNDPADVARVRSVVDALKAAGYTFFAVVGAEGKDEVDAGNGYLIVERLADPIRPPALSLEEEPPEEELEPIKKKRGRPPGVKNKAKAAPPPPPPDRKVVAVRQMKGG